MPAIFTDQMKDELGRRMVEEGWRIVRTDGIRALRVERVTRAVGIAKGTFYSFFGSKEEFVFALMTSARQEAVDALEALAADGPVGRERARTWLRGMWHSERNIYRQVSGADYQWLCERLPPEASFDPAADERVMGALLQMLDGVRPKADWRVVANLQKALALVCLSRDQLHADALDATIDSLVEAILDELFGR